MGGLFTTGSGGSGGSGESGVPSSSRIVTWTDDGLPAVTSGGKLPSATVNVSLSSSASCAVVTVPVPVVCPPLTVMLPSEP